MNKWSQSLSGYDAAAGLLLLSGALLRLRQFLTGRSLWADEAMLALNIVSRDLPGMLRPLDYDQGAPVGFLLVEKIFSLILGRGELALRLFPLLVGLTSLWLFYLLSKRVLGRAGSITALALFALNPRLVYYSSEVKQYILDVAVTIALLWIAAPLFHPSPQRQNYAWLALAGILALWFSHPALFVLAGIGLTLLLIHLQRRDREALRFTAGMGVLWLLNVAVLYFLLLRDLSRNAYMREYWQGAFLPVPPWRDPAWFMRNLNENIGIQLGMPYLIPLVIAILLAGWMFWLRRQRGFALAIGCILAVTLIASALQLYPVFERMVLFLVPVGLLLLGQTIDVVYQRLQPYGALGVGVTLLLVGYLIAGPLVTSGQAFLAPKSFEHIRPSMEHLRDSWKPREALYVSYGAVPAFRFYAPLYGLEDIPYESGEREDYRQPDNISRELQAFAGQPRVWVLLSHVYEKDGFNERSFILNVLDQLGKKRREFRLPGTSVFLYLYDLGNR